MITAALPATVTAVLPAGRRCLAADGLPGLRRARVRAVRRRRPGSGQSREAGPVNASHVLAWVPRYRSGGFWYLLDAADLGRSVVRDDSRVLRDAARDADRDVLAGWVAGRLGLAVTLTRSSHWVGRRREPSYWVEPVWHRAPPPPRRTGRAGMPPFRSARSAAAWGRRW